MFRCIRRSLMIKSVTSICLLLIFSFSLVSNLKAADFVHDKNTGFAIYGFDPVAYFTEKKMLQGLKVYEYRHGGVVWRFTNRANFDAFSRNPEVFAPSFKGHDPVQVSRGFLAEGFPEYWAIGKDGKLYLFQSPTMRGIFLNDEEEVVKAANDKWDEIKNM